MDSINYFTVILVIVSHHKHTVSDVSLPPEQQWQQYCVNYTDNQDGSMCRTRSGLQTVQDFTICTCVDCYNFLFRERLVSTVVPNIEDQISVDTVCESLSHTDCTRWIQCCQDAKACCSTQVKSSGDTKGYCPRTWDGYSCVEETPPGQTAQLICPSFISNSKAEDRAYKRCTSNGTWWREPVFHKEWTNYSTCVDIDLQGERAAQIVAIVCNAVSILFLIPALAIFIGFRQLRFHRHVKLHINLSVSLLLTSVTSLLMEKLVYYDGLFTGEGAEQFRVTHEVGCKFLNILDLLFQMCPAFWMLCEGFYLTWLMLRAFQPLNQMVGFYIFGWGLPVLFIIIYSVITSQLENSKCWLRDNKGLQWIVYTPTIACIATNLLLFLVILKVLLTQIQSHPKEPSNFRRVLKATVILIPLFGIQQFCIIYSPSSTVPGFIVYNITRKIIIHSQGFLVALIFCFCNNEVHNQLKMILKRWRPDGKQNPRKSNATLTTSSIVSHRSSLPELEGTDMELNTKFEGDNTVIQELESENANNVSVNNDDLDELS